MDFVRSGVPCPLKSDGLLAFMPRAATVESSNVFPRHNATSAANPGLWLEPNFKKAEQAACTGRMQYVHTNKNWAAFTPRLRIELRAALVRRRIPHCASSCLPPPLSFGLALFVVF